MLYIIVDDNDEYQKNILVILLINSTYSEQKYGRLHMQ